jgi:hypothetical protein
MKTRTLKFAKSFIGLSMMLLCAISYAQEESGPIVFQASGPSIESIQGTVDAYRLALGDPLNGNAAGPLANGRREINWDGGGSDATTDPVTPFDVFLNTRGAQFKTSGLGLSQAPVSGGPQGGLATLFNNQSYANIFSTFSPLRLFTVVGSRILQGLFYIPGSNGATPATVTGFGAIFTDVDKPNGNKSGRHSTRIEYFDVQGKRLYTAFVPASPGDGGISFIGIVYSDARIASIKIKMDSEPGGDDNGKNDIVMMDDFFYGEPQMIH